jgi:molybdopterin synthase catalytic subunit
MQAPDTPDWLAISAEPLPVGAAADWAVLPSCGAVVLFSGTAREHSGDRSGLVSLAYEAYEEHVLPRLERIAAEIRRRWPDVGRVVMWHRVGTLALGESSVVVVVSSPHRPAAFEAARFGIDALKATAPIWKKESWGGDDAGADGGDPRQDWALAAQDVADLAPPAPER